MAGSGDGGVCGGVSVQKDSEFLDFISHRKRSVLPAKYQSLLVNLCNKLTERMDAASAIEELKQEGSFIPAKSVPRAAVEIQEALGLGVRFFRKPSASEPIKLLRYILNSQPISPKEYLLKCLDRQSGLGTFLQFHRDGYIRETSIKSLVAAPHGAFEFTSIVYRLNDWVSQVRDATSIYAASYFPLTDPKTIASSALFLLPMIDSFNRWKPDTARLVADTFWRDDVLNELEILMLQNPKTGLGRPLNALMRCSYFDKSLPKLAMFAKQPIVRAMALDSLINKRARFVNGVKKQWIDKVYNLSRNVPNYVDREFEHSEDIAKLLLLGAKDRASSVRKIIAASLNQTSHAPIAAKNEVAKLLANDSSPAVRLQVDFFMKNGLA